MIEERLDLTLHNHIVTTANNIIVSFQVNNVDLGPSLSIDSNIKSIFEQWDEKSSELILAVWNGTPFMLICTEYLNHNGLMKIYMIHDGQYLMDVEKQVKELNESNRELDAIIESSYDGIYITDKFGNTLKTNSAIERITGIPKHYYIGKNITHLMKRGILEESVTLKVIEQKQTVSVVQKNFNQKETLMTGSPIFNEEGEIVKIVTNIRDLSELNEVNRELIKVQQLNEKYKEELTRLKTNKTMDQDVILKSDKLIEIYNMVERLANFDTTILILGETGVGKDVLARHIYRISNRSQEGQLIKINCGAIPKELLESELFGYDAGAFSGANRSGKAGMFELAHKGMLFLDEVGELPLDLQVKLLRAIQEKEIMRVGGTKTKKIDVRLIAATNRDLKEMVKKGQFREDLFYRLNVVPVSVPPLRERQDDILPLVHYFVESYNKKYSVNKLLQKDLHNFFYHYTWPGNVRELSNLLERLVLTVPHEFLTIEDLPTEYKKDQDYLQLEGEEISLKETVELAEKSALQRAMLKFRTTYEIADHLKISQASVVRKLQKYGLS
ncbi:sigma-54 interaction domain-containing protein [Bacillus pinisoli]|uniref:sigma-54 interaction domain-containing protein n=1 Tax=Bacillus pinisoli TaxID=2901866 RepID=UPI001FF1FDCE|nr:sigma 54-interacting transcriptional regulator [Bacillus pinisoli]